VFCISDIYSSVFTAGQKFAMMELKSVLSKLLRKYKICLGDPLEKLNFVAELVLKSRNGIRLKLAQRK
jgi:cytochrome P450 family 4